MDQVFFPIPFFEQIENGIAKAGQEFSLFGLRTSSPSTNPCLNRPRAELPDQPLSRPLEKDSVTILIHKLSGDDADVERSIATQQFGKVGKKAESWNVYGSQERNLVTSL